MFRSKLFVALALAVTTSFTALAQFPRTGKILYRDGPAYVIPAIPTIQLPGANNCGYPDYRHYRYFNTAGQSNAIVRRVDNGLPPNFNVSQGWNGSPTLNGCGNTFALQVITTTVGSVTFQDRELGEVAATTGTDEYGNDLCGYDCFAFGTGPQFNFTIEVVDFNWVNYAPISEMCLNEAGVSLSNFISYSNGVTFSGPGVSGGIFTPSAAGLGTHVIVANRTFDNCSIGRNLNITVRELPNVAFDVPTGVCNDAVSYPLASYVTNYAAFGGSFSGLGVAAGFFIPNTAGGSGTKVLTYTSGANAYGCTNTLTDNINVVADYSASAGNAQSVCQGATLNMTGASPGGGTWSTNDCVGCITGNQFNATGLTAGAKTATYTVNQSGCQRSANKTVSVIALPPVEAGDNLASCANAAPLDLTQAGVNPAGGSWSSSDNSANSAINNGNATLNPNALAGGSYPLSYTVTVNNCSNTDTRTLTINSPPAVNAGNDEATCLNGGTIPLSGGSPAGGSWSGTGVTGSTFNPLVAGLGNHVITYSYSNGTCSNTDTRIITVNTASGINAGSDLEACVNTGMVSLGVGTPAGGTWTGTGVSGSTFDTSIGAGQYVVTWTATNNGCVGNDTRIMTINPRPSVEAGNNLVSCTNAADFTLSGASPGGGAWSGPGLNGPSLFSPSLAGAGAHVMTYSYTDNNGCNNTDIRTVTVSTPTPVSIGSDRTFCSNSGVYNLSTDVLPQFHGGVWSGQGVSGVNFNPGSLNPGAYLITYTYTNANGCVSSQNKQFTVVTGPLVDAGAPMEVCVNEGLVNLIGESPLGGVWSGLGIVNGNQFNPETNGAGVFIVTYTYVTETCTINDTRQIVVNVATIVDAGNNINVCSNAADFILTGASVNGGTWNGVGVAGGFFSPSAAGIGTHNVTYNYTNNDGCNSVDTRTVNVVAAPVVNAGTDIPLCSNGSVYNLIADVNVQGGTFSGPGVQNLNFNPAIAGVGVHQVNYTFTDQSTGCARADFRYITVTPPQALSVGANQSVCIDATPIPLNGESIPGGTWSGNAVSASMFSPAIAGIGTHIIAYAVPDANGCLASATKTITVVALPTVEAGPDLFVCSGNPLVSLNGTGSPIGGVFSGDHLIGGNFDVASSGPGVFPLTYTFTNAIGCTNTDTKNVVVDAGALVNAGADFSVCAGDPLVNLASRVAPGGGTFVGPGVNGSNFNTALGPGSYNITYTLENSYGCSGSDNFTITVHALPVVNAGSARSLCFNEPAYDLSLTAIPSGGSFFGPGVNGNLFDPSTAGVGSHTVYYTYQNANGCTATSPRTITVTNLPEVNGGPNIFMCVDGSLVDLDAGVAPENGTWTGPGIINGIFNPAQAGTGVHLARYTITQANGCSNFDERVITVFDELAVDAGHDVTVCANASVISLSNTANVNGGAWTGTSVSGSNFNPAIGPGSYVVTLNYSNFYGCSGSDTRTINVIAPQSVSVGSDVTVCSTATTIDLATGVSPLGGTFSGTGLTGNNFNPALAGIGVHPILYAVTDALGCRSSKVRTITVAAPPAIDAGPNKVVCLSNGLVDLDLGASITGGTWTGNSTSGSFFNPQQAGLGTYVMNYVYDDGLGCTSRDVKTITVRADASVDAGNPISMCVNQSPFDLSNQPDRAGGTWSGLGVTNAIFNPAMAGPGAHTLTYRYTDAFGCVAHDTKSVTVYDKPWVSVGSPLTLCNTADAISLSPAAFPAGGSWNGPGLSGTFFNPQVVGTGTHNVTYNVTNANGCSNSATKAITVIVPAPINTGPNLTVCTGSPLVDLDLVSGVSGGTWSGTGVSNNSFDPTFAGIGNHLMTYTYNDGLGCIATDTKTIIVRANPIVNAGADVAICLNASTNLALQVSSGNGGVWYGTGVSPTGLFTANTAGAGIHVLRYAYTDPYGCTVSDFVNVNVNALPQADAGPDLEVCSSSPVINLNQSSFPLGGSWAGAGVSGSNFNPALVVPGEYELTMTYTSGQSCSVSDKKKIKVTNPPAITVGPSTVLCSNSPRVNLNIGVSQVGGLWSGPGLEGSFFNPALAGVGIFDLTYTYNDGTGCSSTAHRIVEVRDNLAVDAGQDLTICINANSVALNTTSLPGGTWSGPGVNVASFNPAIAGVGAHLLTYQVTDEFGCRAQDTRNILVNNITTVEAGPPATACTTGSLLELYNATSIQGGVWSGPGIQSNRFNPTLTGVGTHNLTYTYTNFDGCTSTDTRQVTVSIPESVTVGPNQVVCRNSPRIDLDLNVSKVGGTWSGSGALEGSFFNPALASPGNYLVTYAYNNGLGCISTTSKIVQVRQNIAVNAGNDVSVCLNAGALNLSAGLTTTGGTWSGPGITNATFNPAIAGVGSHDLTYRITDEFGCIATDSKRIVVNAMTQADAGPPVNICSDENPLALTTSGFPAGGSWSGQGVANNLFHPQQVGPGNYSLTYSYADQNGCSSTDNKQISVTAPPVVNAGADFEICINASPIALSGAQPPNGSWSGIGVIAGVFDPLSAGLGEKTLTYNYTDQGGCRKSDAIRVLVLEEPSLTIGSSIALCLNSSPQSLLPDASIKGGTFTGKGVTGSVFNPLEAGPGTHVITYTVRFNGCDLLAFRNITVNSPQVLSIGDNFTMCLESNSHDLITDVNVVGGTFSGNGVTGTIFNPKVAGIGSHVITYAYTNAFGCLSSDFRVITVQEQLPISAGADITLCSSLVSYELTGRGTPEGGVYVGQGVQNNAFNPNVTGLGKFNVEYVVDNGNGCVSRDAMVITVKASTINNFGKDSILCITASPMPLNFHAQLAAGNWNGNGVVSNAFYPSLAGIGTHTLNYNNQHLDCDIAGRRTITVVGLPKPATSEITSASGCNEAFIELKAKVSDQDRESNITVGWYRKGSAQPFTTGDKILYQVNGHEEVYFKALSPFGCTSGQNDYVVVKSDNPAGDFYTPDLKIPFGKSIQFFPTKLENASAFRWDFGDGLYSLERYPWKYYYESGDFDVSLTLTSPKGCETVVTKKKYINVLPEPGREGQSSEPTGGRTKSAVTLLGPTPNPHSGTFSITLGTPFEGDFRILAINSVGQPSTLNTFHLTPGPHTLSLDMTAHPNGLYSIIIEGPSQTLITFKTLKQ